MPPTPHPRALADLSADLARVKRAGLATQKELGTKIGVSQSTVSKALRGSLKRESAQTRALAAYAKILLEPRSWSTELNTTLAAFFAEGGTEADLIALIHIATTLVRAGATLRTR